MNATSLTFRDASLAVLNAVIVECSKQRGNLVHATQDFSPRVHCSGHGADGRMIYHIDTPVFTLAGVRRIIEAAEDASKVQNLREVS